MMWLILLAAVALLLTGLLAYAYAVTAAQGSAMQSELLEREES